MKKIFRCHRCKVEQEELWEFGPWERFKKYWGKEYCKNCFDVIFEKFRRKNGNV